ILFAEQQPLNKVAQEFGTPCYVYSRAAIERQYHAFADAAAKHPASLVCYAVKANSNLAILNLLAKQGSGFDIVSAGELRRVIAAGGDPAKVVFSGVAKTADEMRFALDLGIKCFNVESSAE
ncbi:diaminopimelate decarboxylase family protein, partial [Rheinheimera salexigens]